MVLPPNSTMVPPTIIMASVRPFTAHAAAEFSSGVQVVARSAGVIGILYVAKLYV